MTVGKFRGLVCALVLLLGPAVAGANGITVSETADELNSDGDCSLREAVRAANTDSAVDNCNNGTGAVIILVPAGTYQLS
ncbi:MAG TPA: CSLREA domain-containing protein, partial [Gammaproteobacteria bacterium]|nr:CSLREA domain-containing protein [Gammaproteobacteria bacterium]